MLVRERKRERKREKERREKRETKEKQKKRKHCKNKPLSFSLIFCFWSGKLAGLSFVPLSDCS